MKRGDNPLDRHAVTQRPARLACLVTCAALLLGCVDAQDTVTGMRPAIRASPDNLRVATSDGLVTVQARDVSVWALLEEVARQSRLIVVSHDPLDERVTLDFQRLPLPEALDRILRDQSFALEELQRLTGAGDRRDARPRRLWVFSKGPAGDHASADTTAADDVEDLDALDADGLTGPLSLALADDDTNVRLDAVSALAAVGSDQAAATLAAVALSDGDSSVREEAVYALGEIGGEIGIQVLAQALIDPDDDVREAAVEAFANIGGDESALALAVALNDGDDSVRAGAVDALGEIGGETAIRLLRQASLDEESSIGESAAELLAELSAAAHIRTASKPHARSN